MYVYKYIWMFPKIGVFPPKWMVKIMENPIKMDDLGGPLLLETPIYIYNIYTIHGAYGNVMTPCSTLFKPTILLEMDG